MTLTCVTVTEMPARWLSAYGNLYSKVYGTDLYLVNTVTGFSTGGFPFDQAIGTDGSRIFTWDVSTVYVTDMAGLAIENFSLPRGNYGFSLKYVNGLLFASVDGDGGTGHWYGYDVGQAILEQNSWGSIKGLFQ